MTTSDVRPVLLVTAPPSGQTLAITTSVLSAAVQCCLQKCKRGRCQALAEVSSRLSVFFSFGNWLPNTLSQEKRPNMNRAGTILRCIVTNTEKQLGSITMLRPILRNRKQQSACQDVNVKVCMLVCAAMQTC